MFGNTRNSHFPLVVDVSLKMDVNLLLEKVSLICLTLTEIVVFITNGLSATSNASKFGFINSTGDISDKYYTQVGLVLIKFFYFI